jgi:hypothetical protein
METNQQAGRDIQKMIASDRHWSPMIVSPAISE